MNKAFLQRHIGTFQLFLLTISFALPLFSGFHLPFSSLNGLAEILAFEFGVLIYGFYLAGFLYLPVALTDSVRVRRVCLFLACVLAIPLTSGYRDEYGFYGFLNFCILLFANYSSLFIASIGFKNRQRLAIEAALRCVVYIVIFSVVVAILDMRVNVDSWGGNKALWFGSIYFGTLAFIESQRYFSKAAYLAFHFVNGTYVRIPQSRIRYVGGKIKAHVLSKNNVQRGMLLLFAGSATTAISLIILFASFNVESWFARVALWLFLLPFLILGVSIVLGGIAQYFTAWRTGPSLLRLHEQALRSDNTIYATGTIPSYSKREKRTDFSVELIHYKVDPIAGEDFVVNVTELLNKNLTDQHLTFQTTDRGTDFKVEYSLPSLSKTQKDSSARHVWHLQVTMNETTEIKGAAQKNYSWTVAFPLPLN